jgi:hypothetical protein
MDKQTLIFASQLTGAWQTSDKDMTWLFDPPNESTYPHWSCLVKFSIFDSFNKHTMFLERIYDVYKLHLFDTVLGKTIYILKFTDNDTLVIKTLLDSKEIFLTFFRLDNTDSLFEVS